MLQWQPDGLAGASPGERAAMLRDIEEEVAATSLEIGKDALDPCVMAAVANVPREQFVPPAGRLHAFRDGAVPIGYGQTISQPYIVALMTDLLMPRANATILEIGTGSGYQAAVLARLVHHVYSIEIIEALADAAAARLARLGYGNVTIRAADGRQGWPDHAPFDGIIVTAAAREVPPALIEQLKPGARLVVPVGAPGCVQTLKVFTRRADGPCDCRDVLSVVFVPLTRQADQGPASSE